MTWDSGARARTVLLACSLLALSCAPVTGSVSSSRGPDASELAAAPTSAPTAPSSTRPPRTQTGAGAIVPAGRDPRTSGQAGEAYVQLATEIAGRSGLSAFTGRLANWPVTGRITSPFAPRWGGFHNGIDIAAPMLTSVRASAAGQVIVAGRAYLAFGDTGMMVIVAHGSNFATLYTHLSDARPLPVSVGERIPAGTVIGFIGVTGWTTGPHVHFMTIADGRAVDPLQYLP